ncbi:AI-2E family transporter [Alcanivorax sp. JB21]|uniref:AI-2E family transporter n=1 Tax=Alcanivorax limicola TaxID=2874102 RepID=UPI001CC1942F|nr:AI-2E family transporter [Alcanivorax limicola]MBZ2189908.1 AI-2E family transporter [Alcanivorax limicola]
MMNVIRNWFRAYFSDEEAVYLFFLLAGGLLVILFFGGMLAPVLTALVLAYLMQGLVTTLMRWGLPEKLSVGLVYLLFVSLLVATLVILLPVIWKQTVNLIQDQLPRILNNSERWLRELPAAYPEMISMRQVDTIVELAQRELANAGQAVLSLSLATIPSIVDVMIFVVLVPLLVFFFLVDRERLMSWSGSMLPDRRRVLSNVWAEMDQQIANYVRGKAIEILIVGATSYIVFKLLGVNYALLLAVLVGLSVVIPYIGATVVTIPVAAVAWVQFGWGGEFALVMALYAVIQFLDANVLVPFLFSEAVNLHPVAIITAILFFGGLWGFWGVFFAIPLATLIKAVLYAWPRNQDSPIVTEEPQPEA